MSHWFRSRNIYQIICLCYPDTWLDIGGWNGLSVLIRAQTWKGSEAWKCHGLSIRSLYLGYIKLTLEFWQIMQECLTLFNFLVYANYVYNINLSDYRRFINKLSKKQEDEYFKKWYVFAGGDLEDLEEK